MDHLEYKIEMRGPLFQTKITFFQAVILQPDQSLIIFAFPAGRPAAGPGPASRVRLRGRENHNHLKNMKFLSIIIFEPIHTTVATIIMFVLTGNYFDVKFFVY